MDVNGATSLCFIFARKQKLNVGDCDDTVPLPPALPLWFISTVPPPSSSSVVYGFGVAGEEEEADAGPARRQLPPSFMHGTPCGARHHPTTPPTPAASAGAAAAAAPGNNNKV